MIFFNKNHSIHICYLAVYFELNYYDLEKLSGDFVYFANKMWFY